MLEALIAGDAPTGYSLGAPRKKVTQLVIDAWEADPAIASATTDIAANSIVTATTGFSIGFLFTIHVDPATAADPAKTAELQQVLVGVPGASTPKTIAGNSWLVSDGVGHSPMYAIAVNEASGGAVVFVVFSGDTAAVEKFLAA